MEGVSMEDKSRRTFLTRLVGAAVGGGAVAASWPLLRSLVPNVLYEAPKRFSVGLPESFQQGVTFIDQHRIFLFRDGNAFFVISAICTHLGCTIKFSPFAKPREEEIRGLQVKTIGEFHCPCHGSRFRGEGSNYSGPAPRPLRWHLLELSPSDGRLVVDLAQEVDRDFRLVV